MTQSSDPWRQAAVITCYLDESGGDNDPTAVLGGLLLSGINVQEFGDKWKAILAEHRIAPPLHMTDFGSGGIHGLYPEEFCKLLFTQTVALVNDAKIISVASVVTPADVDSHFSAIFRDAEGKRIMGTYGLGLFNCVNINHDNAIQNDYTARIPYLLDIGNPYRRHAVESYAIIEAMQTEDGIDLHAGGIAFQSDTYNPPLQAADMIAWSVRRKRNEGLAGKFGPLEGVFDSAHREDELGLNLLGQIKEHLQGSLSRLNIKL